MINDRIAVCSWSLRPDGPEDLVASLNRLELGAVQLALGAVLSQPDRWGRAIRIIRAAGIRIVSGMMAMIGEDYSTLESIAATGGVRRDAVWSDNLANARAIAALASEEGIGLVTFHGGFIPEEKRNRERAVILDRLRIIADEFAGRGVGLALETGQETAHTLLEVLKDLHGSGPQMRAGSMPGAGVGVNFDPANMILYDKGDPVAALRLLALHVRQIHVKDAVPTGVPGTWGREVPVGSGAVDWPAFLKVARSIEPPVNFVIEREAGATRETDIAAARDLLRGSVDW